MLAERLDAREIVAGVACRRNGVAGVFFEIGIEDAMDDEVGVASDRRGEVGVVIFRQTVVTVGRGAVGGLFQTAQELGAQRVALGVRREDDE